MLDVRSEEGGILRAWVRWVQGFLLTVYSYRVLHLLFFYFLFKINLLSMSMARLMGFERLLFLLCFKFLWGFNFLRIGIAFRNVLQAWIILAFLILACIVRVDRFGEDLLGGEEGWNWEKTFFFTLDWLTYFGLIVEVFQFLVFLSKVQNHKLFADKFLTDRVHYLSGLNSLRRLFGIVFNFELREILKKFTM